ncbi:hypothetical protein EB796_012217 [Bugula neritina]|uniref:Uncharacterized protein n=1 Tax=Bugula neritina TaxID=10212 RepID=A0A7J7JT26_BUGNE|nr:hypothetical protein EB796_012217 [Bugula neritina]
MKSWEMATLKEMFSQQLHDLQTDLDKKGQQVTSLTSENEELQTKIQDQLTKSREIIKKLTEEKKSLAGKLVEAQETLEKEISEHQQKLEACESAR